MLPRVSRANVICRCIFNNDLLQTDFSFQRVAPIMDDNVIQCFSTRRCSVSVKNFSRVLLNANSSLEDRGGFQVNTLLSSISYFVSVQLLYLVAIF